MPDVLTDSTARLDGLLEQFTKETDPMKSDELETEIWRIVHHRVYLHETSGTSDTADHVKVVWSFRLDL
jgi:hypothetical protein